MTFNRSRPYNDLPSLPPAGIELETARVLKKAILASRALGELKGMGETIPNQAMLINTITLQEARSSSEIENIVTTQDALYQAFTASTSRVAPATKEVLLYREAIWDSFNALKKKPLLTTNLFVLINQTIRASKAGIRATPGTAIANASTGDIIYMPPEGEGLIRAKLKNLEDFIHAEDGLEPLVRMAVMHYQFEAIHPFTDGNGRTGRILNILFLVAGGLLDLPVLYLSKYIIEHKQAYYRKLRDVPEHGAWEEWVLFMLDAVEQTANQTRERIIAIRKLLDHTLEDAKAKLPARVYSKDLIELIFRQPYTKAQFIVDAGLAERKTAASYLKELEKAGILSSQKVGRENLYLNVKLYDCLAA